MAAAKVNVKYAGEKIYSFKRGGEGGHSNKGLRGGAIEVVGAEAN
jgi:hypothetical protein